MNNNNDKKNKDLESKEGLSDFFSDLGDDDAIDGEYDEIDQMIDEVMALLENYASYSGGLIVLDTIFDYLKLRNYPDIEKSDCFEIVSRLRTNQVILDEIIFEDLPDFYMYVFKDVQISPNEKNLLKLFVQTPLLSLQKMKEKWGLDDNLLTATLEDLQKKNLIIFEKEHYKCPAITKKKN